MSHLDERLNQVLPIITSEDFLAGTGIGNELGCYIFDYPAEQELEVREHLVWMKQRLASHHPQVKVLHLDLFIVALEYLEHRGLLKKTLAMEERKNPPAVLKALKGPLSAERIRDFISERYAPVEHDLFLLSGVGSVWPVLRAHNLLNCLHPIMGDVPLVMFYPGRFDGTTLRLFDQITSSGADPNVRPYYRAFILVPSTTP